MKTFDWIIKGGRVIDPANDIDDVFDIAIDAGRIAVLGQALDPGRAGQVYDASGKLVVPGLIDLHAHVYNLVTPLGTDADYYCLGRGVTRL